jgi:hypothetical protein
MGRTTLKPDAALKKGSAEMLILSLFEDRARMLLYSVTPGDPSVVAGFAALLAVAAVAASLVPGARATRVDPITVLKAE